MYIAPWRIPQPFAGFARLPNFCAQLAPASYLYTHLVHYLAVIARILIMNTPEAMITFVREKAESDLVFILSEKSVPLDVQYKLVRAWGSFIVTFCITRGSS